MIAPNITSTLDFLACEGIPGKLVVRRNVDDGTWVASVVSDEDPSDTEVLLDPNGDGIFLTRSSLSIDGAIELLDNLCRPTNAIVPEKVKS